MSVSRSLSRRSAIAGIGAGSLGLVTARIASTKEMDTSQSLAGHPLTGMWLTHMALPSAPDDVVAVPAFFGADGSAVLIFPCTEANSAGVQLKGAAIGTWAPIDDHYAHVTTVQALSDLEGRYQGTLTFDAYPRVRDDNDSFEVDSQYDLFTLRDHLNEVISSRSGPHANPMRAHRMHPGNPGFWASASDVSEEIASNAPRRPD